MKQKPAQEANRVLGYLGKGACRVQDLLPVTRVRDADLSQVLVLHHVTSLSDERGELLFNGGASTSSIHLIRLIRSQLAAL